MNRNIKDLDPEVARRVKAFMSKAREAGIAMMIVEALRTQGIQDAYYAQGRQSLDVVNRKREHAGLWRITERENAGIITNAEVSMHQFGCAVDVAPIDPKGRPIWNVPSLFDRLGSIGRSVGLSWGGDWPGKFKDKPHFEYTAGLTLAQLRAGMRPSKREVTK